MNQTLKNYKKKLAIFAYFSIWGQNKKAIKMLGHINDYFHTTSGPTRLL